MNIIWYWIKFLIAQGIVLKVGAPMNDMVLYWITGAIIFFLIELINPGLLYFLSFSVGFCGAAIVAGLGYSLSIQYGIALGSTFLAFIILSYWVKSEQKHKNKRMYRSNIYALQGEQGFVVKEIKPRTFGQVKIGGELWSARSMHDEVITVGKKIYVVNVSGAHVIVEELEM